MSGCTNHTKRPTSYVRHKFEWGSGTIRRNNTYHCFLHARKIIVEYIWFWGNLIAIEDVKNNNLRHRHKIVSSFVSVCGGLFFHTYFPRTSNVPPRHIKGLIFMFTVLISLCSSPRREHYCGGGIFFWKWLVMMHPSTRPKTRWMGSTTDPMRWPVSINDHACCSLERGGSKDDIERLLPEERTVNKHLRVVCPQACPTCHVAHPSFDPSRKYVGHLIPPFRILSDHKRKETKRKVTFLFENEATVWWEVNMYVRTHGNKR